MTPNDFQIIWKFIAYGCQNSCLINVPTFELVLQKWSNPLCLTAVCRTECLWKKERLISSDSRASSAPYMHPVHPYLVPVTGELQNGIDYWFPPYHRSVELASYRRIPESHEWDNMSIENLKETRITKIVVIVGLLLFARICATSAKTEAWPHGIWGQDAHCLHAF